MKKVLFVCQVEFGNQADGVVKKIKGQIQAFNNMAFESYCIAYYNGIVSLGKCNSLEDVQFSGISNYSGKFNRVAFWKSVHRHIQQNLYDVIYIRYSFIDFSVLTSLKEMHRKGAKVVLEIPSIKNPISLRSGIILFQFFIDKLLNHRCRKYVDRLLYIGDKEIITLGMKAEPIPNGIPYGFTEILRTGFNRQGKKIVLIAVSTMGVSRGYDRLLNGLGEYLENGGTVPFLLNFVGEGEIIANLKEITNDLNLSEYVRFYNQMGGEKLDKIFSTATIGVGALGLFRVKSNIASTLKVKEYLVRGLPFIYAGEEIEIPGNYKYALQFPNNETNIDFSKIVNFVESFSEESKSSIIEEMNDFATKKFSWESIYKSISLIDA